MKALEPFFSVCLTVGYPNKPPVLHDTFLQMRPGEILGLIGHSGSGKSTLALAILGLLRSKGASVCGTTYFLGRDLMRMNEKQLRALRGNDIALVLQSPLSSLNPALRIRTQLAETWRAHAAGSSRECDQAIREALASVSLPNDAEFLQRYPSQLSVGQAQRVLIAMAVLHRPALLIADEPTSALDVITQSEILQLFGDLNRRLGTAILYISHDLLAVASICQRIAILHEGEIVECGATQAVFERPTHPYTQSLVRALPQRPQFADRISGEAKPGTPQPFSLQ